MLALQCFIFQTISHCRYVAKITDVVVCTYHIETLRNNSQYMILQLNNKTTNSKQPLLDLTNRFICGFSVASSHTTFIWRVKPHRIIERLKFHSRTVLHAKWDFHGHESDWWRCLWGIPVTQLSNFVDWDDCGFVPALFQEQVPWPAATLPKG